jgi:DinB superfamily
MPDPAISRPEPSEYHAESKAYIGLVSENDVRSALESQLDDVVGLLSGTSEQESLVRHAPYTWSIRQVLGHMTDCERVFGYRALRIARNDATPLLGFDENAYMRFVDFDRWPLADLLIDFEHLRRSHLGLFWRLDSEAWLRRGFANGHSITTRAMAYVMAGHARHHLNILRKRLAVA